MKIKLALSLSLVFMAFSHSLLADSPLTSTAISKAYKDTPIVILAAQAEGKLNDELMKYICESKNPVDLKIALINELSWSHDGVTNSDILSAYLKEKKRYKSDSVFVEQAEWDLLICMAYLKALDNYFDVDDAILLANKAKSKNSNSYTVNIICALIEAQKATAYDWCEVYNLTNNVRINPSLKKDMNDGAISIIFKYMDLYKSNCK